MLQPPVRLVSPTELRQLLAQYGIEPRRSRGQNFLIDANVLGRIVAAAGIQPGDPVVEIGPGPGVLTERLLAAGAQIWAIEIDRRLCQLLMARLGNDPAFHLISADAREVDWLQLLGEIRQAVALGDGDGRQQGQGQASGWFKVVANIPYSITTPLLLLILELDRQLERAVLLVQKEVAERLAADAGTPEYGSLTVALQSRFMVELVSRVPATVFWPRPAVDSAVIRLFPRPERLVADELQETFTQLVRAAFGQRRKTLWNALRTAPAFAGKEEVLQRALAAAGIEGVRRGETLTPQEFELLARTLRAENESERHTCQEGTTEGM